MFDQLESSHKEVPLAMIGTNRKVSFVLQSTQISPPRVFYRPISFHLLDQLEIAPLPIITTTTASTLIIPLVVMMLD